MARYPKNFDRHLKNFPEAALAYDAVWAVAFALQNATRAYVMSNLFEMI